MLPLEIFNTFIYQPFFNILVFFYWCLDQITIGPADMGIAVILLTILIRVLLLPLSLAGARGEKDRREIAAEIKELEERFGDDTDGFKKARKKLFTRKRSIIVGELISLFIQVMIALMLWRVFETGLKGEDLHFIYPFMPEVDLPFNLMFLDRFDLSHSNLTLNLIQSLMIFIFETVAVLTSPYPPSKGEVVRLQLTLPVVSFFIFLRLPAGKKLFVITTLVFSTFLTIAKFIFRKFMAHKRRMEAKEAQEDSTEGDATQQIADEKLVVDIK